MQQKIQRAQVQQFVPFDTALYHFSKEMFYPPGRDFANQQRIVPRIESNDSDIGSVALIAGAGVCDPRERDFHSTTSTEVWISSRGINAGQYATTSRTGGRPSAH